MFIVYCLYLFVCLLKTKEFTFFVNDILLHSILSYFVLYLFNIIEKEGIIRTIC